MTTRFPNGTGNSPRVWTPSQDEFPLTSEVRAGDWWNVELSYRKSNRNAVPTAPGDFLAHVIYTTNADDSMPQVVPGHLQPTMYGGSATKQPSKYRIDPGWTFQAPWDGKLALVGGGFESTSCDVDVILRRGVQPEELIRWSPEEEMAAIYFQQQHGLPAARARRSYAPPVIGHPALAPSTYVDVQINVDHEFGSGVVAIQVTDNTAVTPAPVPLTITALGRPYSVHLASGAVEYLGALAQGGGSTDSTPATWRTPNSLAKLVVWTRIGN